MTGNLGLAAPGTAGDSVAWPRLLRSAFEGVERDPTLDDFVVTDDRVTMSLDGAYTGCTDDTQVTARTFELAQAVGTRLLADGRSPWGQPFVFSDADLPDLAAGGWSEQPPQWPFDCRVTALTLLV